jgi:hypothetical protein
MRSPAVRLGNYPDYRPRADRARADRPGWEGSRGRSRGTPTLLHDQRRGARDRARTLGQHGSHPPLWARANAGVDLRAGHRIPHLGAARAHLRRKRQLARPDPGVEPGEATWTAALALARGLTGVTLPAPRDARALHLVDMARSGPGPHTSQPPVMFMCRKITGLAWRSKSCPRGLRSIAAIMASLTRSSSVGWACSTRRRSAECS